MLGGGMAMVLAGVALGLFISIALTRSLNSLLFNVGNLIRLHFLGTSVLLVIVALVGLLDSRAPCHAAWTRWLPCAMNSGIF